ncbi:hypothetical protein LINPERPRIM_LOCUS14802 [Linum perenne]
MTCLLSPNSIPNSNLVSTNTADGFSPFPIFESTIPSLGNTRPRS